MTCCSKLSFTTLITLNSGGSITERTATDRRSQKCKGDTTMNEQFINEIQRRMLPYLNNEQLKQLGNALEELFKGQL